MYSNLYEAFSPYEAEMLLRSDPKEFKRLYGNMRRTLQRRKAVLEKKNRQYTQGYQKIKTALATADGKDKAKSFSLISSTVVTKTTSYTGQLEAEKNMAERARKKYDIRIPKKLESPLYRLVGVIRETKQGSIYYLVNSKGFWQDSLDALKETKGDIKQAAAIMFEKIEKMEFDEAAINKAKNRRSK